VFTGKQSAMHPTLIHLIKHCKKTHEQVYIQGKNQNLKIYKNFQHHYQDK
jgi:ABC-type transporter Mla MlaB component